MKYDQLQAKNIFFRSQRMTFFQTLRVALPFLPYQSPIFSAICLQKQETKLNKNDFFDFIWESAIFVLNKRNSIH
ncbi:hypothetical protein HMPREF1981_00914 [Bacteroides pyogenes F0041]|uniref:Uncharacterized protein n=1 Tax=Bacteroides pyogenes F0041 TaxID=1321819 RepID=U2C7E0_9BACE|nr:hypothetical protein [Bacteroides pyogenes]ERI86404.1 hypothetical protein HMPREF1981_00914 [Bacteroides pyogenes F0041]MBB3895121.1 hypothetical protein [Bacteroides pyogenes]GAE22545.1 hypothetical protein JCM10003_2165 [Bacteroides pyogenes JCM 10003]